MTDKSAVGAQPETTVMQHSMGPWALENFGGLHVRDATGSEVVLMPDWLDEYKAERDANARLIAAAPELLKCLQAVEVLFAPHCKDSTQADWLEKTQALLRRLGAA